MGLVELPFGLHDWRPRFAAQPPNATNSIQLFNAYQGEYPHGSQGWH